MALQTLTGCSIGAGHSPQLAAVTTFSLALMELDYSQPRQDCLRDCVPALPIGDSSFLSEARDKNAPSGTNVCVLDIFVFSPIWEYLLRLSLMYSKLY